MGVNKLFCKRDVTGYHDITRKRMGNNIGVGGLILSTRYQHLTVRHLRNWNKAVCNKKSSHLQPLSSFADNFTNPYRARIRIYKKGHFLL